MKIFACLLLLVAFTATSRCVEFSNFPEIPEEILNKFGKVLALSILKSFEQAKIDDLAEQNARIFSDFEEDQVPLDDVSFYVSIKNEDDATVLQGDVNFCNGSLSGLNSIENSLSINITQIPAARVAFLRKSGTLAWSGLQDISLYSETLGLTFTSNHTFLFKIHNYTFDLSFEIEDISQKINITDFHFELSVAELELFIQNTVWNGTEIEDSAWEPISAGLTIAMQRFLQYTFNPIYDVLLEYVLQDLLQECYLIDLLLGNYECIGADQGESTMEIIYSEFAEFARISSGVCFVQDGNPEIHGTTV